MRPSTNATLVRRVDLTDDLAYFWVKFDEEPTPFDPGQYMTTGVFADGKLWQRPYSVASPPRDAGTDGYELYVRLVPIIRFTTLLWRLAVGHRMRMIGPKGKFLLDGHSSLAPNSLLARSAKGGSSRQWGADRRRVRWERPPAPLSARNVDGGSE